MIGFCPPSWTVLSWESSEVPLLGVGGREVGPLEEQSEAPGAQDLLTNSAWTLSTVKLCVDGRVLDPAKRRATAPGTQRDVFLG